MADDRLMDARAAARTAIERYDGLDRKQRMDEGILKEHAIALKDALETLVTATDGHFDAAPEPVEGRLGAARQRLDEFADPTVFDHAQHVRRACYVFRQESDALLNELEEVEA